MKKLSLLFIFLRWHPGADDYGQLVLGVEVYLQKRLSLFLGWCGSNSDGQQAVVVQLTYTPQ